jgi:Zn-dependent protease/predicted transcriptional regulator
MKGKVRLGRVFGIPIELDPSWFLIFGLITWSLAGGTLALAAPGLPVYAYWLMGLLTSLLFFGSVLTHELAHVFFALRNGTPVKGITLFLFGGVAQLEDEPQSPGAEFSMAIAGPALSLGLAALFGVVWFFSRSVPYLAAPSQWLAQTNLMLAMFNLVPGFPLDGGRVLRSVIWRLTGSLRRASEIATGVGRVVAWGFMGIGVLSTLGGSIFNGLWLIFIGWYLQNAARSSLAQVKLKELLRGVTVGQVMSQSCPQVSHLTPLNQVVEEQVLGGGQSCIFVTENGIARGLLTLSDITRVPQHSWRFITAGRVMVPLERLIGIDSDVEILDALRMMDAANVTNARVVEDERTVGTLSREQMWSYLRLRSELGV